MNSELGNVLLDRAQHPKQTGQSGPGPSLQPPQAPAQPQAFQSGMMPPSWTPPAMPQTPMEMPQAAPVQGAGVPPRIDRWRTAQHMIDGYQNNWSPNPMLVRILEGDR